MAEKTHKQKIGKTGEDIAEKYLQNKGFLIVDKNYLKKYGEIDIIAKKGEILHFIEVKSVSCENFDDLEGKVSHITGSYRPEDNVHRQKLKRLSNTLQVYLFEKFQKDQPEWVFDVITVKLSIKTRQARIKFLENLIL